MSITTATRCACSTLIVLTCEFGEWQAFCPNCLDGAPDAGPRAQVIGRANSPDEALWDWADLHDAAWEIMIWPLDMVTRREATNLYARLEREIAKEAARQHELGLPRSLPTREVNGPIFFLPVHERPLFPLTA